MKTRSLATIISLLFFVAVTGKAQNVTPSFDAFEAKLKQSGSRAQILDARSEEEYAQNHLKGAISFSVANDADFQKQIQKLNKQNPVFVYSIGNGRSGKLAKQLQENGFIDVTELPGGLSKWIGSGRPVESTVGKGLSLADYQNQLDSEKLVLIDFGSRYCGSCKKLAPTVEALKAERADVVKVITIEAYENKDLVKQLGITSLPTLVLYKNKQIVWQKTGVTPRVEIDATIAESL